MLVADAFVFGSHDDADGVGVLSIGIVIIALFGSGHYAETALLQVMYGGGKTLLATNG